MRIGFNIKPLKTGHKLRGIGSYTQNLLEQLRKRKDIEVVEFEDIDNVGNVDLVHYPFFDLFKRTLPNQKNIPMVVTIHDAIPLKFSQYYPMGFKGSINLLLQKRALQKASAVITDSYCSKVDINKYLKVDNDKIFTVYLGVSDEFKIIKDPRFLKQVAQKYHLPEKFVLFVGNVNWNKNLSNLANACDNFGVNLVLVGSGFNTRENLKHPELQSFSNFLKKYGNNPLIKITGFVEPEDLPKVINLASALALPSYYEGFGLPILEAQACKVPVITSNISSMPEVAGEGAILVDPGDVTQIEGAIKEVLNDEQKRVDLIERGLKNVAKFSWEKCAQNTTNVYKSVLNQK